MAGISDISNPPGRMLSLWPQTLLWAGAGVGWAWATRQIYRALRGLSPKPGVFQGSTSPPPFSEDHRHVTAALWLGVAAVLCAVILPPVLIGEWTLQPVQLWHGLYATYGMSGILASAGWLIHHVGFCCLVGLALATTQSLAEVLVNRHWVAKIPVGGLVLGLIAGLLQASTGGPAALVTALIAITLLGGVHLLTDRRLRWTVPATALVLVFL